MALRGAEGGAEKRSAMPAPKAREGGADPSTFTCTLKCTLNVYVYVYVRALSARTTEGGAETQLPKPKTEGEGQLTQPREAQAH